MTKTYCVYIKYRRPILNPGEQLYLRKHFPRIMWSLPGCETVEYSLQVDPVHMMIIPLKYAASDLVNGVKGTPASRLGKSFRGFVRYVQWPQIQNLEQANLEFK